MHFFHSLQRNLKIGDEGAKSLAEALKTNSALASIQCAATRPHPNTVSSR